MNKKGLSILMRTRIPTVRLPPPPSMMAAGPTPQGTNPSADRGPDANSETQRSFGAVRECMHSAISMNKTEVLDTALNDFSQGYLSLSYENRRELLLVLAKGYDLDRTKVRDLIKHYLGLQLSEGNDGESNNTEDEIMLSAYYRVERNLRQALKPTYGILFERLNNHPGGLKFLSILRADILSTLEKESISSLRALDGYMKEKLSTWLSPAALELHQITWDYPASLLEKIVAYEAVHPISNLIDLKRRLGVGRRCFGYLHPSIPGEPLIFIEVALLKNVAQTIQEVLWDDPPTPESEASCALFYSISSTQPGLAGINLGKFLIKRVITLVKRDMPHISATWKKHLIDSSGPAEYIGLEQGHTLLSGEDVNNGKDLMFATLSPITGYMQWLLSKLACQSLLAEAENAAQSTASGSASTFQENLLEPDEERLLMDCSKGAVGNNGMEVMLNLLTSPNYEWTRSDELVSALKPPLMRLCARYLVQEKKRGKALDSVANFHLQNGAMIERINWMADRSEKGLRQSGGIMVNYVYRMENIEEYAQLYFSMGYIHASDDIRRYAPVHPE